LTSEERERLDSGDTQLWAYGFVYYNDFMDESHQIGAIVKWDAVRGFVQVVRENYSYHRHEKIYTKEYRQAEGNEAPIRT
jgi:hypothetical protein